MQCQRQQRVLKSPETILPSNTFRMQVLLCSQMQPTKPLFAHRRCPVRSARPYVGLPQCLTAGRQHQTGVRLASITTILQEARAAAIMISFYMGDTCARIGHRHMGHSFVLCLILAAHAEQAMACRQGENATSGALSIHTTHNS